MRFHQKVSRTGYGTAFVGLRNPIVHFALATGFLALQPAMKGNTAIALATVGNGAVIPAGRIMPKIAVPSSTRDARKASRVHGPTKVYRRGPSLTATSSPTTSTGKMTILSASLVSVGVGAALALGSSNAQGDSSAGEQSSRNGGDDARGESSGENGRGEGASPPPGDNPDDPSGAGNGDAVDSNTGYRRGGGGSPPPPPPPPPSGTGVDDDNSRPAPPPFDLLTLLVLLSYLLCKRELDNRRKEFEQDISAPSTSGARTIDSSLDTSSFSVGLGNVSLIVDVQPSLDLFEDFGGNEFVHVASSEIAPLLEIALSAFPPPATVEFWDAGAAQKIPVSVYEPMSASPNILPLHETMTCSADDKPAPKVISALLSVVDAIYMLFMIVFCGIVVYILGYITCSGFGNDAAPEDMDEVEFSHFRPAYDPQEVHVAFKPAELHLDFPDHCPKPDFYLFSHFLSQTFFSSILGFFVPPEPQPEFVLLPPDRRVVVPPLEEPAAFIEEVDEADIIDGLLALVLFQRPLFVLEEPVALLEEVDEPLALVVFQRPLVHEHPVVLEEPVAFIEEVNEPLPVVVNEPVPAVFGRPDFVEDEPLNVNPPLRGLNPLAPAFVPAAQRIFKPSAPEVSSIPVFEAIQRGRRHPRSGRIPRHKAAFVCG